MKADPDEKTCFSVLIRPHWLRPFTSSDLLCTCKSPGTTTVLHSIVCLNSIRAHPRASATYSSERTYPWLSTCYMRAPKERPRHLYSLHMVIPFHPHGCRQPLTLSVVASHVHPGEYKMERGTCGRMREKRPVGCSKSGNNYVALAESCKTKVLLNPFSFFVLTQWCDDHLEPFK